MKSTMMGAAGGIGRGALAVVAVAALPSACDVSVVNPGRVQEDFLLRAEAQAAIVQGNGRAASEAHNWVGYTSAAITREIHPSGSTGSFWASRPLRRGRASSPRSKNTKGATSSGCWSMLADGFPANGAPPAYWG